MHSNNKNTALAQINIFTKHNILILLLQTQTIVLFALSSQIQTFYNLIFCEKMYSEGKVEAKRILEEKLFERLSTNIV